MDRRPYIFEQMGHILLLPSATTDTAHCSVSARLVGSGAVLSNGSWTLELGPETVTGFPFSLAPLPDSVQDSVQINVSCPSLGWSTTRYRSFQRAPAAGAPVHGSVSQVDSVSRTMRVDGEPFLSVGWYYSIFDNGERNLTEFVAQQARAGVNTLLLYTFPLMMLHGKAELQEVLVRRRTATPPVPEPRARDEAELRALLRELRQEVLLALGWRQPMAELGAATKPVLTSACKRLILDWLSDRNAFVSYGKMGLGRPVADKVSTGGLFCVCEKVHGANFSAHVDRLGRLRCAKRTAFLGKHEDFFGHCAVLGERHAGLGGHASGHAAVMALAEEVFAQHPDADRVILFGELCGGKYPHKDVRTDEPREKTQPVQLGIWYSPRVEWMVFDIALRSATGERFLPYSAVVELARRHGLFCAEPLRIDRYQKCVHHPARFQTQVPTALHAQRQHAAPLPPLAENLAEGIVIKPWDTASTADNRPILKLKIEEFSEGGGQPPDASDAALREFVLGLMNRNRVAAARSKVGPPPAARQELELWRVQIATAAAADCLDDLGDAELGRRFRDQLFCAALAILSEGG